MNIDLSLKHIIVFVLYYHSCSLGRKKVRVKGSVSAVTSMLFIIFRNLSSNNLRGSIPIELSRIGNLDTL